MEIKSVLYVILIIFIVYIILRSFQSQVRLTGLSDAKSTQEIECIADSVVIEFSITEGVESIFLNYPEIETLHRKNLERVIVNLQKRILNQLQMSSLDRYNLFLQQHKNIEKYALNYHIASYLGITQQSLSRIRAENYKH